MPPTTARTRRPRSLLALLITSALLAVLTGTVVVPTAAAAGDAKLLLVLDSSGSMKEKVGGRSKISIAKRALGRVVDALPGDAAVGLRVYGATVFERSQKGACTDSQLVVPIGTGNRDALRSAIAGYRPYGETPIAYALKQAAEDVGTTGKRTIVLVSDGEETCDTDPCLTAARLAKQGIDLRFDVIGLRVSGRARSQLQCIADKGNGTYYDADDADQIEESLDKLATRAFRPFRLTGTAVEGSTGREDAPEVTAGQYVDTFPGDDDSLFYRVRRTMPMSTLRVGATAEAAGFVPTMFVRLYAAATSCTTGLGQVANVLGTRNLVSAEASSWSRTADSPCNTADDLVIEVKSGTAALDGRRFEFLVSEEPPVTSTRSLAPAAEDSWQKLKPTGSAEKAPVAGTSLSDAPVLSPGTYQTSILTGEKQVFAVPLDWGQRLEVLVQVAPRKGALARALDYSHSMDVQLIGPMRGEYSRSAVDAMPKQSLSMAVDGETYRVTAGTPTIRYLNRTATDSRRYAAQPGLQYIGISKSRMRTQKRAFLVPYTLVVAVIGTAGDGAPEYGGPPASTDPSSAASSDPSASGAATAGPSGASTPSSGPSGQGLTGNLHPNVVIGIGIGALVLGLFGGRLLGRRRDQRRP